MLLVLWAAWIQENARGQILLQHLEAPRIAGPKKKRLGTQISPLRGINNTTTECRDGLRQL